MNRNDVEMTITEYLKPIYGFALKRCKNTEDAEDLCQEIVLRAFRALLIKDDVGDMGKFIWTIAHNTLANYYRSCARRMIGVSLDEVAEVLADPDSLLEDDDNEDAVRRLQSEIAYLSKLQRKIVIAYYFENRKQADIAKELDIPLGTVKWHLFEAKKELKRGMDTMRKASTLKFNPIKFDTMGICGSIGKKGTDEYCRTSLSQNICYSIRNEAKTVSEIADDLGVSPVYVETELEYLEEMALITSKNGKYLINFLISEPTEELLTMQDAMYKKAAALFANDLYDELVASGLLDSEDILCNQMLPGSTTDKPLRDHNFLLWSLIPYAISLDEAEIENQISFEEVATLRPDGAHNITHATVLPDNLKLPEDYVYMKNWCGPYYSTNEDHVLWRVDSQWSGRRIEVNSFESDVSERILALYEHEKECYLTKDDYAFLAQRGFIHFEGDYEKNFKTSWMVVVFKDPSVQFKLYDIVHKLNQKYKDTFAQIKAPYVRAALDAVPYHLRKMKAYELQYTFHADGWFLLHCLTALLKNGKLHEPTEAQRKSLSTVIACNRFTAPDTNNGDDDLAMGDTDDIHNIGDMG